MHHNLILLVFSSRLLEEDGKLQFRLQVNSLSLILNIDTLLSQIPNARLRIKPEKPIDQDSLSFMQLLRLSKICLKIGLALLFTVDENRFEC